MGPVFNNLSDPAIPQSTVERVDCMVCEQYDSKALRAKSTLSTECSELAGRANGDMGHGGKRRNY